MSKNEITLDDLFNAEPETLEAIVQNPHLLRVLVLSVPREGYNPGGVNWAALEAMRYEDEPPHKHEFIAEEELWGALNSQLRAGLGELVKYVASQDAPFSKYKHILATLRRAADVAESDNSDILSKMSGDERILNAIFEGSGAFLNSDAPIVSYNYMTCLITHMFPDVAEQLNGEDIEWAKEECQFILLDAGKLSSSNEMEVALQVDAAVKKWYMTELLDEVQAIIDTKAAQEPKIEPPKAKGPT